jgi:hypothetical protein
VDEWHRLEGFRGHVPSQAQSVSLIKVENLIPAGRPILKIKRLCGEVLRGLSERLAAIHAAQGTLSIPPETLLKVQVLQGLDTVCSERQLCARMQTDRITPQPERVVGCDRAIIAISGPAAEEFIAGLGPA